jgi:hypothetical protein
MGVQPNAPLLRMVDGYSPGAAYGAGNGRLARVRFSRATLAP